MTSGADERRCWLCGRALGRRVQWHHTKPKSRGGREVAPIHPICHATIHAHFSNAELARRPSRDFLLARPEMTRFLAWIESKPPDFHAPTHRKR
ncbi:HNH endonuclease [Flavisphingomonas formosensis]|uniref:HNH endonuclease n=1 Tax=Flavisphingomonas formosensis TaxID=861534 RepID=UPI0012FC995A|nr:HNH endonuclease [Sphingomonas formosensis]